VSWCRVWKKRGNLDRAKTWGEGMEVKNDGDRMTMRKGGEFPVRGTLRGTGQLGFDRENGRQSGCGGERLHCAKGT